MEAISNAWRIHEQILNSVKVHQKAKKDILSKVKGSSGHNGGMAQMNHEKLGLINGFVKICKPE